jgi:hypothetical protein
MVPSPLSRKDATVFEARPSAVVKVVKRPWANRLTPPLIVPAQTAPSRAT